MDGSGLDGAWTSNSCTHTQNEVGWWQVDLGTVMTIDHVDIYTRTDCCQERRTGAEVIVSARANYGEGTVCGALSGVPPPEQVSCAGAEGRFVTVARPADSPEFLNLCEIKVFAAVDSIFGGGDQIRCEATRHFYEAIDAGRPISWVDAREGAIERGGHLATITSEGEQGCIVELPAGPAFGWLGATDINPDRRWMWTSGDAPFDASYTHWAEGQPDTTPADAINVSTPGYYSLCASRQTSFSPSARVVYLTGGTGESCDPVRDSLRRRPRRCFARSGRYF